MNATQNILVAHNINGQIATIEYAQKHWSLSCYNVREIQARAHGGVLEGHIWFTADLDENEYQLPNYHILHSTNSRKGYATKFMINRKYQLYKTLGLTI